MRIFFILVGLLAVSGCEAETRDTPCTRACAPNPVYDIRSGVCWCDMRFRMVHIEPNSK